MKTIGKFIGATLLLGGASFAVAVYTVPSLRQRSLEMRDEFLQFYKDREAELIEALSPSDDEVEAARNLRSARASSRAEF